VKKPELRKELRTRLEQLSFEELISKSGELSQRFHEWATHFESAALKFRTILNFYPFGNEPQVQVEPPDPARASRIPYRIAYLRIEDWDQREMKAREARRDLPGQWEEYALPGGNKIFQPLPFQPLVPPEQIAAVLVPGLGFTPQGQRLGRGAGFYDRYLSLVPQALRVGVAFELQIVDTLPCEEHDLPVDIILTESRLIETGSYAEWQKHGRIERE
jgi:5-formyltetrahydrofolate cyclo-ligase